MAAADYDLRYDAKRRVLLVAMGSTVTKVSALATYYAVRRFIVSEGPCSVIADLSAVKKEQLPGHFVRSLASMPSSVTPENQLILVAPQDVIYGLSRMFHSWRDGKGNCEVVRSLKEAYALLNLEAPDFRTIEVTAAGRAVPIG